MLTFEWNPKKNRSNIRKHGICFEEAKSVFADANARLIHDPDHSKDEDRFVLLGLSNKMHTLVVCHCYRESEEKIRIISARKATRHETTYYWEGQS